MFLDREERAKTTNTKFEQPLKHISKRKDCGDMAQSPFILKKQALELLDYPDDPVNSKMAYACQRNRSYLIVIRLKHLDFSWHTNTLYVFSC